MPLRAWCGVWLAVTEPIDQAVEPPSSSVLLQQHDVAPGRARLDRGREPASAATDDHDVEGSVRRHGDCLARWPAVVPAILPNTAPFIRPVPPG